MATKKTSKPISKAAKPTKAAVKAAKPSKKATAKSPKKSGGGAEDEEFLGIEDDEFKVDDEMDMNMFSDNYDEDDDY
jgi:hypothetical protein